MPTAIITFVGWAVEGAFAALTYVGLSEAAALFVIDIGIKMAGLALLGNLATKLVDIPDVAETARSNLVTVRGTLEHQRIIYGEALVSGPLWYMNTAGTNNQSLYHCVVVAGHEIEDITNVWLDDNEILEADIDWAGDGSVDANWPRGDTGEQTTTYFDKFLGADTQTAPSDLVSAFTEITADHRGRGIAWFMARTDYFTVQAQVWSAGVPINYRALVKGKKVYNPNSDDTQSWGTGPHRLATSSTWEFSDNPALCWADYMIDDQLGFGESPTRIDYSYVASVAAINSAQAFNPTDSDRHFRCNGTLSTGTTYQGNLQSILSSANMTMALVQGIWKLRGWEYTTPTLQFGDDELRQDIQIGLSTEENKRYNSVRGTFIDKARQYQAHPFPAVTAAEYVTRDNGETLFNDISLPMTNNIYMAQRLAFGILEQSDLQKTVIYPSNFKTLPVEIGGTIALSNTKMGWDNETFRVTNYKLSDMKGIDLVLQEDNAAAYTPVGTAEYTVSSGNVYSTAGPGVPPVTVFTATAITNVIRLAWVNPAARLFETVDIFESINSNDWSNANLVGSVKGTTMDRAHDDILDRWYWARAVDFAGNTSLRTPDSDTSTITALPGAGGSGNSIIVGAVFLRKASAPTEPITDDGSYNFNTNVLTPPSIIGGSADDWSVTVPAGTNPLYVSHGTFEGAPTSTDSTVDWTAPVILASDGVDGTGTDGTVIFHGSVFLRKATAPTEPVTNDGSYNFSTLVLTPPAIPTSADDWSIVVPAGTDPLYVSSGIFEAAIGGTDSTVDWTAPAILASDGAPGTDGTAGLPGAGYIADYDDMDTNGAASTQGKYHFLETITDTSGTNDWDEITGGGVNPVDYFSLFKTGTAGTIDHSTYFDQVAVGDIMAWWLSDTKWVSFRITSIETPPTSMYKWGISYIAHEGTGDPSLTSGVDVEIRFSRNFGAIVDGVVLDETADSSIHYNADTQPAVEASGLSATVAFTPITADAQVMVNWSVRANESALTSGTAVGFAYVRIRVTVGGVEEFLKIRRLEGYLNSADEWVLLSGSRTVQVSAGDEIEAIVKVARSFSTSGASPAQDLYWEDSTVELVPFNSP